MKSLPGQDGSFRCPSCPFTSHDAARLRKHADKRSCLGTLSRLHAQEMFQGRLDCPRCSFVATFASQLLNHVYSATRCEGSLLRRRLEAQKARVCPTCRTNFRTYQRLQDHLSTFPQVPSYQTICIPSPTFGVLAVFSGLCLPPTFRVLLGYIYIRLRRGCLELEAACSPPDGCTHQKMLNRGPEWALVVRQLARVAFQVCQIRAARASVKELLQCAGCGLRTPSRRVTKYHRLSQFGCRFFRLHSSTKTAYLRKSRAKGVTSH